METADLGKVPIQFGAPDRPLFGWFHPPTGDAPRGCGVVIAGPIGDDTSRAHRPLRHLAERLARRGFPVLRFDFHGTGDSAGDEWDGARVPSWRADVDAACNELEARGGVARVTLVGLRLGATLAASVAAVREDLDALVLWAPYLTGRAFVDEAARLERVHRALERRAPSETEVTGGTEALGFVLTNETVRDLERLDLLALPRRPSAQALVIGVAAPQAESALVKALVDSGCRVSHRHIAEGKFLVTPPQQATLPEGCLSAIEGWLDEASPPLATRQTPTPIPRLVRDVRVPRETPVTFGAKHPLFGVLVRPSTVHKTAVIVVNAGTVHRIGPHRQYVALARRWADLGVPVLRMDLSGIGDSPAAPDAAENLAYPHRALDDVRAGMSFLAAETGAWRFVVVGICSGADVAFQAGLRLDGVAGVVMLNPRTFCMHELDEVEAYKSARWYEGALARGDSWRKLLRGQVNLARAARAIAPRLKQTASGLVRRLGLGARDADESSVPAALARLPRRGVDALLVVSERDPGVDFIDGRYPAEMQALRALPGFRREDLPGADHTFTTKAMQRRLSDLVTEHLSRRHLGEAAA